MRMNLLLVLFLPVSFRMPETPPEANIALVQADMEGYLRGVADERAKAERLVAAAHRAVANWATSWGDECARVNLREALAAWNARGKDAK